LITLQQDRYSLNYKGIPYKTEWVEFPDIEALCIKIGAKHTRLKRDGSGRPLYTLPVIHDPRHGVIADSAAIAEYLDSAYPTHVLFPNGTKALQLAFESTLVANISGVWPVAVLANYSVLNSRSQEFYRRTREVENGKKLEELAPPGPVREKFWNELKGGLEVIDGWLKKEDGYVMGETISYADFVVAARFIWMRTVFGEQSSEWKDLATWNGGRWERLLKSLEQYTTVV